MNPRADSAEVQALLGAWWYDYDEADIARWPRHFTESVRFCSRSDSGTSRFEAIVRNQHQGRDRLVADLGRHRQQGLYPVRHLCTNVHLLSGDGSTAEFRCYVLVHRVGDQQAIPIATARCFGRVERSAGELRISELELVFDLTDSASLISHSTP